MGGKTQSDLLQTIASGSSLPGAFASTMRKHKAPGKTALEDVRQLPSIWTPKPVGNISDVLEGFHAVRDVRSVKKSPAPGVGARFLRAGGGFADDDYAGDSDALNTSTSQVLSGSSAGKLPRYMMY